MKQPKAPELKNDQKPEASKATRSFADLLAIQKNIISKVKNNRGSNS
jgi:hypothetical protein